ncbi:uncharacterized protein LOC130642312 [Hydractinia symbiolongicarpus]|uniref:uncharacterized protein LOC130642312 n=1 Tax=Hydractinia symbiolongicarpus TaxID=13093 RepID=UPI002551BC89|nr:uncharacterized protein LOC130642312 [Hydractinia symbiolongicarpus]
MSANLEPMVYHLYFPRDESGWTYSNMRYRITHVAVRATCTRNTTTMLQYCTYRLAGREYFSPIHRKKLFQQYCVDSYVKVKGNNLNYIRPNQTNLCVDSYEGLADHLSARAGKRGLQPGRIVVLLSSFQGNARAMAQNYQDAIAVICQRAHDRPDLVFRVFKLKLNKLLKYVTEMGVLGKTIAHVYVTEFQKRGLPHRHLLTHIYPNDKLRDADDIDSKYGVCTKSCLKNFLASTVAEVNGYPLYRRRDNGVHINVNNVDGDNRWIVPYNPWLSKKYNARINLEACMSFKSVKYLYKYIYKVHDYAKIKINERIGHDEVKTFLDSRYVSALEAISRLFEFNMHQQSHFVHRLPVYLPNNQIVYLQQGQAEEALDRAAGQATKLTDWFVVKSVNYDACQYIYPDIPLHFVFIKNKVWKPRQRGNGKVNSGIYSVIPRAGELFYLLMLLLHTPGATSFEDLRTVIGNISETFRDACLLRGLLQDDTEWNNTLQEAVNFQMPRQLRQLLAVIIIHCEPSDPITLWTRYKDAMYEDYIHQINEEQAEYRLFQIINASQLRTQLTDEQTALANAVIEAVVNVANNAAQNNRPFYLEGAGGSGKTFIYNYLISELTGRGFQVGTAAFTGIVGTLLKKGTTIHRKIVLLGGNFSKLLPVVRKGKSTEIVDMCLKISPLWHLVKEFRLLRNMRTRPGEQQFAAWLLQLGKGVIPV